MTAFAADCYLWRSGDTKPVFMAPVSATVINVGDLCFKDPVSGKPEPASDLVDQGSEALNQDAFQQFFLGVALQASRDGDTDNVAFATDGEFEFDCASTTPTVGTLFGVDEASNGTELENKKLVALSAGQESRAVAKCVKEYSAATTKVLVRIFSTIMGAGIQTQVAGSSSGAV